MKAWIGMIVAAMMHVTSGETAMANNAAVYASVRELHSSDDNSYDREASILFVKTVFRHSQALMRRDGTTLGQIALRYERAARRIESMSYEGVSERAVTWSFDVAQRIRNVALMYRDVGMRASVVGDVYRTSSGGSYYWGYYYTFWTNYYRTNQERRVAGRDAVRFKLEQYNEIRRTGTQLRYDLESSH